MTIDEFVKITDYIDVDGAYGPQCWDLVELYAQQVLRVPKEPWAITLGPTGSAREAWTVFDAHLQKYFIKIPKGQEQTGDIAVYDGHGIYTEGHIAVVYHGQVFEQNADPDHSAPHLYTRANTYLLGSLRLKTQGATDVSTVSDTEIDQMCWTYFGYGASQEFIKAHRGDESNTFERFMYDHDQTKAYKAQVQQWRTLAEQSTVGVIPLKPGKYSVGI